MKKEILPLALVIIIFISSFYLYPSMPNEMPIHWNAKGEIDGYGSRFMGLFLFPLIILGIYLMFLFMPKIMVNKLNFKKFEKQYYGFRIIIMLFFTVIYTATLLPQFDIFINFSHIMIPAIAVLFIYIGYMLKFIKKNYFIGIRTPWTLANDEVWEKTHQLGSKLFILDGLILLSSIFLIDYFVYFVLVPTLGTVIVLFLYSYLKYKKIKK